VEVQVQQEPLGLGVARQPAATEDVSQHPACLKRVRSAAGGDARRAEDALTDRLQSTTEKQLPRRASSLSVAYLNTIASVCRHHHSNTHTHTQRDTHVYPKVGTRWRRQEARAARMNAPSAVGRAAEWRGASRCTVTLMGGRPSVCFVPCSPRFSAQRYVFFPSATVRVLYSL
jgi:hypothetical protein